jgi:hypothetical protein
LVLEVKAVLEAKGLPRSNDAVVDATRTLRTKDPWKNWSQETLWRKYWVALKHHGDSPEPIPAEDSSEAPTDAVTVDATTRNRWTSLLQKWGLSLQKARDLVNLLIAKAAIVHRVAYLGELFDYASRRRTWNRGRKVAWLRRAAEEMERRWPAMREGSDENAKAILAALRKGPTNCKEIVAATELNPISVHNLLVSMCHDGEIERVAFGRYALPTEHPARYVPPSEAILRVLSDGSAIPAEIRTRTGLTKAQTAGALHVLKKRGKVVPTEYGKYALPGTAAPHVYTKDALDRAMESGLQTVPEFIEFTGKNRGEIWAALRRKKAKGEVIQAYLVYPGRRGRLAAFAPSARH